MNQRIELVVFDLGGVLVQADRSWTEAARRLGFELEAGWLADFQERLGSLPLRGRGELSSEEYFVRFAEASRGVFSVVDAERISHASLGLEYPGIDAVFDRIEAAGVPTAALSNTSDDHWRRLFPDFGPIEFPALQRISHRLASHLLAIEKPDPRAFHAVEQLTGHSGSSILFFDDKDENLLAARTIGWQTHFIDYLGDPARQLLAALDLFAIRAPR